MNKIFVYGTLKKGGRLHHRVSESKFICTTQTNESNFVMSGFGFSFPVVSIKPKDGLAILGELYEVNDECLAVLDQIERGYTRRTVSLDSGDEAFIYLDNGRGSFCSKECSKIIVTKTETGKRCYEWLNNDYDV